MVFTNSIRSRLAGFNSDQERRQNNRGNSRAGSMGGTNSYYGPKGDGPGSYEKTGYRYVTTKSPGGRGSDRKEIAVYTWQPDSSAAAQAAAEQSARNSNPTPLSIDPSRGTGKESDIMNALKLELNTAQQSIADLQARQAQEIQATQASYMSQIKSLQSAFDQRYGALQGNMQNQQAKFEQSYGELQNSFDQRYGALERNMLQQQQSFQTQTNLLNQQVQAAQNAYQQQVQLTQNLQSAYVPPAEQTAASAAIGDQRSPEQTGRISSNNSLSSLSILSGLGTSANPLAGLQLA